MHSINYKSRRIIALKQEITERYDCIGKIDCIKFAVSIGYKACEGLQAYKELFIKNQ